MAGGVYAITFDSLTGLTAVPFLQVATPATMGIEIISFYIGQETSEANQQEAISIIRRSTASTLPTAVTPAATSESDGVSALTGSTTTNAVGIATGTGTAGTRLKRFTFNTLNGLLYLPVPEERITMKPSSFLTIQFVTAPAANTWSGQLIYRELN